MSYGVNWPELVGKILRGAKPGDIPSSNSSSGTSRAGFHRATPAQVTNDVDLPQRLDSICQHALHLVGSSDVGGRRPRGQSWQPSREASLVDVHQGDACPA